MRTDLKKIKIDDFDNISLTAFRILSILSMLLKTPCNDKEINQMLTEKIRGSKPLSNDTICIYLNTLRLLGCEISRPAKNNNHKYVLNSHPFKLSLTKEEVFTLTELRKHSSILNEWKIVLDIDNTYNKLLKNFCPDTQEFFISTQKSLLLREVNSQQICVDVKQLEQYCNRNKILTIEYNSPESGVKNITLKAEKITMENGAFYLVGYNEEIEEGITLRLDRILTITSVNLTQNNIKKNPLLIKYKLTGNSVFSYTLSENASIIEKNDREIIIKEKVTNKFKFFQKILTYGSECIILSPDEIREEIKDKLKKMYALYKETRIA